MLSSQKKPRLVLIDKEKARVTFQENTNLVFKNNLNLKDLRPSEREIEIRKRRSTLHARNEVVEQTHSKKQYKFSSTVKKTRKTTKFKNLWISKRGTRNFYIMENQDFVLIDEKNKDYRLYSILDGHGKYGKLIAETAANKLSSKYLIVQKNIYKENPQANNQKIMKEAIEQTNRYLFQTLSKEVSNSGCTLLTVLIRDQKIYCFNVGSSRAVLAVRTEDENFLALPLSSDQNLKRFDEKFRILQTKAVLEQLKDENGCRVGPERIWKKGQNYPGVYITRSLGMRMSEDLGIICQPEVTCLSIKPNYEFIIACSDGFWEVFSNSNAVEFIGKYWKDQNLEEGIDNLLDEAVRRWDKKLQLMDDISIAVIRIL